jgi:hypothetical protein
MSIPKLACYNGKRIHPRSNRQPGWSARKTRAVADFPSGFVGYGPSPKQAARDLQVQVFSATAASFADSTDPPDHLTNFAPELP